MAEALHFFKVYEFWIYIVLGIAGIIYLRKFALAWQELRGAIFGLERENAQSRLNQAASALVLLTMLVVAEFVVVSFIAPLVPEASPLPTPTIDLLATTTSTLEADLTADETPEFATAPTALPTVQVDNDNCIPDQIMITSPRANAELRGEVEIRGTADTPEFGFFKLEYARRDEPLWLTIQAGRDPIRNDVLVPQWDTSLLAAGEFILQLVIVDRTGQSLPSCRIPVRIVMP